MLAQGLWVLKEFNVVGDSHTNQDGIEIYISIVLLQVLIISSNVGARPLSPEGVQRGWGFAHQPRRHWDLHFHRFTTGITSASKTSRLPNHNGGNVNIWTSIATRTKFNPLDYASTARYYLIKHKGHFRQSRRLTCLEIGLKQHSGWRSIRQQFVQKFP